VPELVVDDFECKWIIAETWSLSALAFTTDYVDSYTNSTHGSAVAGCGATEADSRATEGHSRGGTSSATLSLGSCLSYSRHLLVDWIGV
jgi:hypothetical protein